MPNKPNNTENFWTSLIKVFLEFLASKLGNSSAPILEVPKTIQKIVQKPEIDWTRPTCMITEHFSVGEAIVLHAWNRLATETDGLTDEIKQNIIKTCEMMEQIRTIMGCPLNIHCIFRSEQYNKEVIKSPAKYIKDVHSLGQACDWDANSRHTIEEAKTKLRSHLAELNIRMESGTTTWIHSDWHSVGPSGREFKA